MQFATRNDMKQRILIFSFFAGVLDRGIPLYVDNLAVALEAAGIECRQVRCPRFLYRVPRPLLNLLFVLTEQVLMPVLALFYNKAIYPYNSVSLCGSFSRRTAIGVHDFISNHRSALTTSSLYVTATQRFHALLGGDVIYASRTTQRIGLRGRQFPRSRTFCFPNTFYRISNLRSTDPPPRGDAILLCSGWGFNKDIFGALNLYHESGLYKRRALQILGLAGHAEAAESFCKSHPAVAENIVIFPRLEERDVVFAYESAAWVWIHTLREGYGRSLAEARLCGSRVVASDIAPFREHRDAFTFLYAGLAQFHSAVLACESICPNPPPRLHFEHDLLMPEIERFVTEP